MRFRTFATTDIIAGLDQRLVTPAIVYESNWIFKDGRYNKRYISLVFWRWRVTLGIASKR